jgi:hypothetical protein
MPAAVLSIDMRDETAEALDVRLIRGRARRHRTDSARPSRHS